jgi:DNA polymerase-1
MTSSVRVYLIDGSSYIYRAFYAIRDLKTSQGVPTNAIYGFTSMLSKVLRELKPAYLAVVLDARGPTFRHKVYQEYKANRPEMPERLVPQIPWIKGIVEAFGVGIFEKEGYEADDIIGTMASTWEYQGHQIVIVSGDKDLLQLVTPNVTMLDTMYDRSYDAEKVIARYGVPPVDLPDLFGLVGDTSDNIPGVPGIGGKGARRLLEQFKSLEALLSHAGEIPEKRVRESLIEHADQARLSKQLATIDTSVPLDIGLEDLRYGPPQTDRLREIFKELEFHRLLQEWTQTATLHRKKYELVENGEALEGVVGRLGHSAAFAIQLTTSSSSPMRANLVGLALAIKPNEAFFIPLGNAHGGSSSQLTSNEILEALRPFLEDAKQQKIGSMLKSALVVLRRHGISLEGLNMDTEVASYVLNPSRRSHDLEGLALEYLDQKLTPISARAESKGKETGFGQVPLERATTRACEEVDAALQLSHVFQPRLGAEGLARLYFDLEVPLIRVLARMEMNGIRVDVGHLSDISLEMEREIQRLEAEIHQLAGESFNINSPQQLGKILFEKLKLPSARRTKTGYATDMGVLQDLARAHDLPGLVLDYRSLHKLKSTYVDVLPQLVHPETGRIHTSFNQTATATGRLSSSEPNLQNIPIRSEFGQRIREAFVSDPGCVFLSADYSQVELRILAHLSNDVILIESFQRDEDIHARTASEIFGVDRDAVTPLMRREAKVVNFGIIYGMSAYGLARDLKVETKVAQAYIEGYFQRYKGVNKFIERVLEETRKRGYVETLMGRRRYLPEISGSNAAARRFAERIAINTSIQGTAADIIKKAMVRIQDRLDSEGLAARMLVQVHDELLLEVPEGQRQIIGSLVKEEMEGAESLAVPLKIQTGWGYNWAEAH